MRDTFLAQINVTRDCNLRCNHCYIHSDTKRSSGFMDAARFVDTIRGLSVYLATNPNYRLADVHVIGGEPTLLGVEYYRRVLPEARAILGGMTAAYSLRLVTNLLGEEALEIARMFDQVSTSYEVETRFPKVALEARWMGRVAALQAEGRTLQVSVTMTKPVVERGAIAMLEHLVGLGLTHIHFGFFVPSGDAIVHEVLVRPSHEACATFLTDVAEWYLDRRDTTPGLLISPIESLLAGVETDDAIDDIVCPIISGCVDVNWNGDASSCLQTGGNKDAVVAGNVFAVSLQDVMSGLSIRREVVKANRPRMVCSTCEEYSLCRGACGVMHEAWDGRGECPGFRSFIRYLRGRYAQGVRSLQGRDAQVAAASQYMSTRQ
jgi:radical SAM protein with 4Fe4S-binding SPASM domain